MLYTNQLKQVKNGIITTPIKALSVMLSFMNLRRSLKVFATIGIMTGDVKFNPDAACSYYDNRNFKKLTL